MLDRPKLEILAREITTVANGTGNDFSNLIKNIRDDNYPKDRLIQDLIRHRLSYFANKLNGGYYEIQNKIEELENGKTNS